MIRKVTLYDGTILEVGKYFYTLDFYADGWKHYDVYPYTKEGYERAMKDMENLEYMDMVINFWS